MVLIKDIAESMGESERTMKRLIKLNDLIPEIQTLVSVGSIGVRAAEQLAYLTEEEQTSLFNLKEGNIDKLTLEESKQIRTEIEHLRD
ncbi:hypothetical protein D1872_323650 [compost metagenome]